MSDEWSHITAEVKGRSLWFEFRPRDCHRHAVQNRLSLRISEGAAVGHAQPMMRPHEESSNLNSDSAIVSAASPNPSDRPIELVWRPSEASCSPELEVAVVSDVQQRKGNSLIPSSRNNHLERTLSTERSPPSTSRRVEEAHPRHVPRVCDSSGRLDEAATAKRLQVVGIGESISPSGGDSSPRLDVIADATPPRWLVLHRLAEHYRHKKDEAILVKAAEDHQREKEDLKKFPFQPNVSISQRQVKEQNDDDDDREAYPLELAPSPTTFSRKAVSEPHDLQECTFHPRISRGPGLEYYEKKGLVVRGNDDERQ